MKWERESIRGRSIGIYKRGRQHLEFEWLSKIYDSSVYFKIAEIIFACLVCFILLFCSKIVVL